MDEDDARILVVDDMADVAATLAAMLELSGYKVWIASSGKEALEQVEAHRPHCVLLDVEMPGMDGSELAQTLRDRYRDDIVLVAITGRAADDERVKRAFACVDHYLQKPVDPSDLEKLLPPLGPTDITPRRA